LIRILMEYPLGPRSDMEDIHKLTSELIEVTKAIGTHDGIICGVEPIRNSTAVSGFLVTIGGREPGYLTKAYDAYVCTAGKPGFFREGTNFDLLEEIAKGYKLEQVFSSGVFKGKKVIPDNT